MMPIGDNWIVGHLASKRFRYIDDNPRIKTPQNNIIFFDTKLSGNGLSKKSFLADFDPRAVLRSDIDYRSLFFKRENKNIEIISYATIFRRGWKIVKRPIIRNRDIPNSPKFCYYLRHDSDAMERIGQVMATQPAEVLIQLDNINKVIRLVGKKISYSGGNVTEWKKYLR